MRLKDIQRNDVERTFVRRFQIHGARFSSVHRQQPRPGTNAPGVTGFVAREIKSRGRRDEVVSHVLREEKKIIVQHTADRV